MSRSKSSGNSKTGHAGVSTKPSRLDWTGTMKEVDDEDRVVAEGRWACANNRSLSPTAASTEDSAADLSFS
jgi:hypothetical protein